VVKTNRLNSCGCYHDNSIATAAATTTTVSVSYCQASICISAASPAAVVMQAQAGDTAKTAAAQDTSLFLAQLITMKRRQYDA
jgi:hypothetical protein